jgi:hypothetical protein
MENPFVRPIGAQERIKAGQVCPKCLAQVYSVWGGDLRVGGRCPQCQQRLYILRSVVHAGGSALAFRLVSLVAASVLIAWALYAFCL